MTAPEDIVRFFSFAWWVSSLKQLLLDAISSALLNHEQCQKFSRKQVRKTGCDASIGRKQEKSTTEGKVRQSYNAYGDSQEKRNMTALLAY